jgi:hypothetical protein
MGTAGAAAFNDSYIVEKGNLSALPPGVNRIVDGTRKLFEVGQCQDTTANCASLFAAVLPCKEPQGSSCAAPQPVSAASCCCLPCLAVLCKGTSLSPQPSHNRLLSHACCTGPQVRTMQEHWDLMRSLLVRDVAYQAPIIAAYDRCGAPLEHRTHFCGTSVHPCLQQPAARLASSEGYQQPSALATMRPCAGLSVLVHALCVRAAEAVSTVSNAGVELSQHTSCTAATMRGVWCVCMCVSHCCVAGRTSGWQPTWPSRSHT